MWLLVLEIGLIAAAWKRGWKGWALLPLAIQLSGIFLARVVIDAAGWPQPAAGVVGTVGDVLLIGALVIMVAKPRRPAEPPQVMDQPVEKIQEGWDTSYDD